ncbi:exonuclease domain-containing protein [bacterium]|nr:exonuclease domain-containing protein [bacterium]
MEDEARRHLGYSQWRSRRDEWRAWQKDQPKNEVPQKGPWTLVARTERHPQFNEQYGSLPSHLPGWRRSSKQRPPRWCQSKNLKPQMIGIDCEMCETDGDQRALVGVSVVGVDGSILLKTLVKPPGKIVDLKTDITGLKMKDFKGVKTTLSDVQDELYKICGPNTILVGHGLVHDLKSLKFDHSPVIDTAFLFSYKNLPRSTPGLADLCKRLLSSDMRTKDGTHDSVEDAKMALELAKWECLRDKPSVPLDPPEDKVDARDLCKLFIHRLPRGVLESDVRGVFEKARGSIGVEHAQDIEAVHGKFLGPETPLDLKRTTSVYVEFVNNDAANAAFTSLRGSKGTDALGRPQKTVKMLEARGNNSNKSRGTSKASKEPINFSKMTVVQLKLALEKKKLRVDGLKADLVKRLSEAEDSDDADDSDSGSDSDASKDAAPEDFTNSTVPKLREALESRGLDTSGLKADLVKRLESSAKKKASAKESEKNEPIKMEGTTRIVMVRKMAAHGGRAIGASDKSTEPTVGTKRKSEEEKKQRRVPRLSRRARMAAKGIVV